jgi:UDP-N-acetylglucosamine transferase subunit ALG13
MIFVTVGTHEQPFNRLVEYIDKLKADNVITDEVIIQTGYSTYEPKYCKWNKLYSYQEMIDMVEKADIIITHGGPSTFIMPLQVGKTPIVVPRQLKYNEHVNNHQVDFSNEVSKRQGNIIVVENIDDLKDTILNYEKIVQSMTSEMKSNNLIFNNKLQNIVDSLFGEKK